MGAIQMGRARLSGRRSARRAAAAPAFPRSYQGVYSPTGRFIAFVRNAHGRPVIYLASASPRAAPIRLTADSQPHWQPILPTTTQQAKDGA
jgi:Tol biopolymer transport system component